MNQATTTDYERQEDGIWRGPQGEHDLGDDTKKKKKTQNKTVLLLDVYETRQKYGYCSIAFSVVQTIILIVMMIQCGVAPIRINPMVGPYPDALNYWGAKNSALILQEDGGGEYWRLASPMMLHAGILHLAGNVPVQLETGVFFEKEWGSPVWLLVYVASAIGSSVLSTCLLPNQLSVGSSGAVMGLFGAKLSEIFCRSCESQNTVQEKAGHEMRKHQLALSLGGVVIVMLFSFVPFVDWAAHLGGLLAGMAVGLTVFAFSVQSIVWRLIWFVAGLALTVTGFAVAFQYMYNEVEPLDALSDVCGYYQEYFEDYECSCTLDD